MYTAPEIIAIIHAVFSGLGTITWMIVQAIRKHDRKNGRHECRFTGQPLYKITDRFTEESIRNGSDKIESSNE